MLGIGLSEAAESLQGGPHSQSLIPVAINMGRKENIKMNKGHCFAIYVIYIDQYNILSRLEEVNIYIGKDVPMLKPAKFLPHG